MICAGAFDAFDDRGQLYGNLDALLAYNKEHVAGKEANQDSLFADVASVNELTLDAVDDVPIMTKLAWEKSLLGVYVSGHPLQEVQAEVDKRPSITQIKGGYKGTTVVTTGLVESVRELLTKKGDRMAFVKIANQTDNIELVAFPSVYQEQRDLLQPGTCLAVKGKLNIRNDEPSILVDRVKIIGGSPAVPNQTAVTA